REMWGAAAARTPPAERASLRKRSEHGGQLRAMFGSLEIEQRVGWEKVFGDDVVLPHVDGWIDLGFGVRLDRDRDAVGTLAVDAQLKRDDAVVDDPARLIPQERTREIRLLVPQLWGAGELGQQVAQHLVALHCRSRGVDAEIRARDVAGAVHGAGAARDPVLLEPRRTARGGAREVDVGHADALEHGGLRWDLLATGAHDAELGKIAERRLEAGRRDHVVSLEHERSAAVAARGADAEPATGTRDFVDGRVHDHDATAQDVVLVGLHAPRAHSHERVGDDGELRRARGREHDLPRPWKEPVRQLERRRLLPDDEDALARVRLGRARVGVVGHVLDPGDVRLPWLRQTEREHDDARAVLARGRLQAEAIAVARCPGPAAVVSNADPRFARERRDVLLHLRTRWEIRRSIHETRLDRAVLVVVRDERVPVVALVEAGPTLERGERLRPGQKTLEERPAPEHPTRRGVGGDDRVRDAEVRQRIRQLQTAGSAADDHDGIFARREWPLG